MMNCLQSFGFERFMYQRDQNIKANSGMFWENPPKHNRNWQKNIIYYNEEKVTWASLYLNNKSVKC